MEMSENNAGSATEGRLIRSLEELQHLLRLCREGRVYDLEVWIKEGKPL